jgi:hypothetical protein
MLLPCNTVLLCNTRWRENEVRVTNASAAALRWGKGVKTVAVGWMAVLFSAWLQGEITLGFLYGAVASGVLWTVGSFLESSAGKR